MNHRSPATLDSSDIDICYQDFIYYVIIQGGEKSKALPHDQKLVLNGIKACE